MQKGSVESTPVLEMRNISKQFPGVKALEKVNLEVFPGEVHALVGENGAGKSTLMNILSGMFSADEGEIFFKNKAVQINSIRDSLALGISMIHQELMSVSALSVAENIYLGREFTIPFPGWIDQKRLVVKAQELLDNMKLDVDASVRMSSMSVAQQQMIEIAKAVSNRSRLIIMDEPTSAITETEVELLFGIIRSLKAQGIAVIYISHKLSEVFAIADRVTVLRDGFLISTKPAGELDSENLIVMMVGRELKDLYPKTPATTGDEILRVEHLSGKKYSDISFTLHKGEILGVVGLMGAGRTEIMRGIYGLDKKEAGDVYVHGRKIRIRKPSDAIREGIGLVSEDRKDYGLVLGMSVRENITLAALKKCCRLRFISRKLEQKMAEREIRHFRIKAHSQLQQVIKLSGGNQQKVVLGKVLLNEPEIIILDEPTRGIDVGAKVEIYHMISSLASEGKGIIMISSEMPEVLGLSDRVIIIHEGRFKGEMKHGEATQENIMQIILSDEISAEKITKRDVH
ncbi:MAG: sugar ABC transporter ATP-binding protein [Treponema sp.]|jgi:ABC-type sugar transport system ATPase subunit|nr:sugar ABC transporter ATP-binding protein [Treponema sp.]